MEKNWWELQKNAACCFAQILEAVLYKVAENETGMLGTACEKKDEFIIDVLLWILIDGHTNDSRSAKTYIHQLWENNGSCLEDLPKAMADRNV